MNSFFDLLTYSLTERTVLIVLYARCVSIITACEQREKMFS